jgi:hypothetical protein
MTPFDFKDMYIFDTVADIVETSAGDPFEIIKRGEILHDLFSVICKRIGLIGDAGLLDGL